VTEILASTGATIGTYPVNAGAEGVAFDGANIWVTCLNGNTAVKIPAR
jgi:hypothetical protein